MSGTHPRITNCPPRQIDGYHENQVVFVKFQMDILRRSFFSTHLNFTKNNFRETNQIDAAAKRCKEMWPLPVYHRSRRNNVHECTTSRHVLIQWKTPIICMHAAMCAIKYDRSAVDAWRATRNKTGDTCSNRAARLQTWHSQNVGGRCLRGVKPRVPRRSYAMPRNPARGKAGQTVHTARCRHAPSNVRQAMYAKQGTLTNLLRMDFNTSAFIAHGNSELNSGDGKREL